MTVTPGSTGTPVAGINCPEVVAEVTALSLRFGLVDRQQGIAEIAAWRRAHPGVPPGRRRRDTRVLTVDHRPGGAFGHCCRRT
ncbi:MAG TPA: hypothetical protein VGJ13_18090 [Pseudonocardiaceae bacterium]